MLDALDRKILRVLQKDASLPLEEIAQRVGSSKSPVWNRIKKLKSSGVISRQVAILDGYKLGLTETFIIAIKTNQHSDKWLEAFTKTVLEMPEILEAFRLSGEIDYLLKVRVGDSREYDQFYKKLINHIDLFNVTSSLVMERIKETTEQKI